MAEIPNSSISEHSILLQHSQMDEDETPQENLIKIRNKSLNHQHTPAGITVQDQCKSATIQQLISEYKKYTLRKTHHAAQVAQLFRNELVKRYGRLEDQVQEKILKFKTYRIP